MGNRKEPPSFWASFLAVQPAPPARPSRGPAAQLGSPLPRLGPARWPSCGLPRAPSRPSRLAPARAPRPARAVGAAALPCGAHPPAPPKSPSPSPFPNPPRARSLSSPPRATAPAPSRPRPTPSPSDHPVSPGPPSLSLPRPLLPSAWVTSAPAAVLSACGHGGHGVPPHVARDEGTRPRPLAAAPARRSRLGVPPSSRPRGPLPRPRRPWHARAAPPASVVARPGLGGLGALPQPPLLSLPGAVLPRPWCSPPWLARPPSRQGPRRGIPTPPGELPCPVPCARLGPVPGRGAVPFSARRSLPRRARRRAHAAPPPCGSPPPDLAPAPAWPWRARPARRPCSRHSVACPHPAWLPIPSHRPGVLAMARRASASTVVARPGPCPWTAWPLRSAAPARRGFGSRGRGAPA
jgi:hypothetical protein